MNKLNYILLLFLAFSSCKSKQLTVNKDTRNDITEHYQLHVHDSATMREVTMVIEDVTESVNYIEYTMSAPDTAGRQYVSNIRVASALKKKNANAVLTVDNERVVTQDNVVTIYDKSITKEKLKGKTALHTILISFIVGVITLVLVVVFFYTKRAKSNIDRIW